MAILICAYAGTLYAAALGWSVLISPLGILRFFGGFYEMAIGILVFVFLFIASFMIMPLYTHMADEDVSWTRRQSLEDRSEARCSSSEPGATRDTTRHIRLTSPDNRAFSSKEADGIFDRAMSASNTSHSPRLTRQTREEPFLSEYPATRPVNRYLSPRSSHLSTETSSDASARAITGASMHAART